MHPIPKTPGQPRFAHDAWIETLDLPAPAGRMLVVAEPGAAEVWICDPSGQAFRRLALAEDDRVRSRATERATRWEPLPEASVVPGKEEGLVQGERFGYVLRDQALVKVARLLAPEPRAPSEWDRVRVTDADVLGSTIEYQRGPGMEPFRHRFAVRTAKDTAFAALLLALSAMRPPVLQIASGAASVPRLSWGNGTDYTERRAVLQVGAWGRAVWWALDPVVVVGGRWWLVAASIGLAVLMAWAARRRLRRLGADAATIRFWTTAVLLLGPAGAWAAIACERPRAWADRAVRPPVAAPRIASAEVAPEVVA
jgi:hypothetical protein